MKARQMSFTSDDFKKIRHGYGGELLKKAAARKRGRPLVTKSPMHLVLRSSLAKGAWSFQTPKNARKVSELTRRFAKKYGVQLLHGANVGNHLHLMIRLRRRQAYVPFIRALTGAIAMTVTDTSKWRNRGRTRVAIAAGHGETRKREVPTSATAQTKLKFWDYRPFTRVIEGGRREYLAVADYILVNRLEGLGVNRIRAETLVRGASSSA